MISGAAGFGGALPLLPVATACVGAEAAVPMLTIAQIFGNLSRMAFGLRQIQWKPVGLFCVTALPLAALGAFGFAVLPKGIVTRCIGAVLVLLVLYQLVKKKELKAGKWTLPLGGAAMGAAMVGGTFLANRFIRRLEKGVFRKYVAALLCVVGLYLLILGT